MKTQMVDLGCSFDWDRELSTCDPDYYRWTQYLFLKLHEAGLAYQKEAPVNWDPVDFTVLADEQIDDKGRSWRSGAKVERRMLKQWYLRTTAYSKQLIDGLKEVDAELWRDIISLQAHWIGNCDGMRFDFQLLMNGTVLNPPLSVFTHAPQAVFGISERPKIPQAVERTERRN
jgi:leucyl-tRNA synthetase